MTIETIDPLEYILVTPAKTYSYRQNIVYNTINTSIIYYKDKDLFSCSLESTSDSDIKCNIYPGFFFFDNSILNHLKKNISFE